MFTGRGPAAVELLSYAWRQRPLAASATLLAVLAQGVASLGVMVYLGTVVEDVHAGAPSVATSALVYAGLLAGVALLEMAGSLLTTRWESAYLTALYGDLADVATHRNAAIALRRPGVAQRLSALRSALDGWLVRAAFDNLVMVGAAWLMGVASLLVVASWRWWPGLLLAAAFAWSAHLFGRWSDTVDDDLLDVTGTDRRRAGYLRSLLVDPAGAREVRIFGVQRLVLDRWQAVWHHAMGQVWAGRRARLGHLGLATVAVLVVTAGVFALLVHDALEGRVAIGHVVTVVAGITGLAAFGDQGDAALSIRTGAAAVNSLDALATDVAAGEAPHGVASRSIPVGAVRLRDVAVRYPDGPLVLDGLDLDIAPGEAVALVGVNGAGKSTLVRVLLGLLTPERGEVLIGADAGSPPVSAVLQRFGQYPLNLAENVHLGRPHADGSVERALADARADEVASALPEGVDTLLVAGSGLSGGQ